MSSILTRESSSEAVFLDGDDDATGCLPDARIDPVEVQAGLMAKRWCIPQGYFLRGAVNG